VAQSRDANGGNAPVPSPARGDPPTPAPGSDAAALARHAFLRGQHALTNGDSAEAVRWLDRAHRLAPNDGTVTLALASACLRDSAAARAEALFLAVAEAGDVREAWLGLAVVRLGLGNTAGAGAALAAALARHAPEEALLTGDNTLAGAITRRAGAPGWCGLTGDGRLVVRPAATETIEIRLDGRRIPGGGLPRDWSAGREISVLAGTRHLLGSPIQIGPIRRVSGFVEAHQGGLRGWAWHPGDPDTDPELLIQAGPDHRGLRITATDQTVVVNDAGTLARPRGFIVPAKALARLSGLLHVRGRDGSDLLGSPIDPAAEQLGATAAAAALALYLSPGPASGAPAPASGPPSPDPGAPKSGRAAPMPDRDPSKPGSAAPKSGRSVSRSGRGASTPGHGAANPERIVPFPIPAIPADAVAARPATAAARPGRPVAIVMPVYGRPPTVLACLDSVLATVAPPHQVIAVDDASSEPELRQALDRLAQDGRLRLLRHARNQGFPASANDGIAAATGHDVVLLNSDTLVPPGWLERLRAACHAAPDIGTATPLSNHASILSYPGPAGTNPLPDRDETARLDAAARRANGPAVVDIPVGVGFCLYLRLECIATVGPLRADVFAQGYGEENDFCLRARALGWRNVAVPGVFVAHLAGASFGPAGRHLQVRNEALLNRLHPGYDRLVAEFAANDPLAEPRRRIDLVRWRAASRGTAGSAILITHNDGGGVERQVGIFAARHRAAGLRAIILRPEQRAGADPLVVVDGADAGFPNLGYALPGEMSGLLRQLRATSPRLAEVHHTLHHPPAILDLVARLGVPYQVFVHDYPWFCPQVALIGPTRRYCGEPNLAGCVACVADAGSVTGEDIAIPALRRRSAKFLGAASRVAAPSEDAAVRMRNHFPNLRPVVLPHEDDASIADPPPPRPRNGTCRVCLLGAIGVHKGYDIVLACARDAAERQLPLDFIIVGHTIDDARLLATGRVFITGEFKRDETVRLIRAQQASLALLPSVGPETWSFALTELWLAGLMVAAFDIGAPAERIRRSGRGLLLPLGIPARGINSALVAAVGLTRHEGA